ncbi:MAG TPA: hypothetical protein VMZ31_00395 [Phycisphaerae bacterium]|nr:hypothetical protein [Phycisphaerae bacterium]
MNANVGSPNESRAWWLPVLTGLATCVLLASGPSTGLAEQVTCLCIADTWLDHNYQDSGPGMANYGGDVKLSVSSRKTFALLNFDVSVLRGKTIEKATLRLHPAGALEHPGDAAATSPSAPEDVRLHTVGLSTISGGGPWGEGTQTGGWAELGAANFFFAQAGQRAWAYPGSDITDVTFGLGGSLYAYLRVHGAADGWYEIDVPPALVHALVVGDQFGWMLCDEKGQTWTNHLISSRQSEHPPVLVVEATRVDETAPGPVVSLRGGADVMGSTPADVADLGWRSLRPGSALLKFGHAGDDAGQGVATRYELRYAALPIMEANFELATAVPRWCINPLAAKAHPLATANALADEVTAVVEGLRPGEVYHFAARAIDEAGNIGSVSSLGPYRAYARTYPPLPGKPAGTPFEHGQTVETPGVWAVSDMVKINPQTGELLEGKGYSQHRLRNRVWDAATHTVKLVGARNEFVAFQLAIESKQPLRDVRVEVTEPIFADCQLPKVFETGAVQLYRVWSVPDDRPADVPAEQRWWYPDALIPLDDAFSVPASDNAVPNQTVQPVFVDVYIPHDAQPGVHKGTLRVTAAGTTSDVAVNVEVLPLTLPDKLSFVVDLNCYSGVNDGYEIQLGTDEYRALVKAYHRLAHVNRTNLNVLGYGQSGNVQPDHGPRLAGEGAETKVASWDDWDAHFAPLLDGSAFADLPRASVPITNMYLAFHENWPGDIHKHYKFDYPTPKTMDEYTATVTRHALEASPIEDAFTQQYQDCFAAVVRQFAEHLRQKGWTRTQYQVYLNNKYYWKQPQNGRPGYGSAWWLLDEPNHRDDVRALSFFGMLLARGLAGYEDVPIIYRTDISRVFWIRDLLAGQIDLNCVSARFYDKNRYLTDNRDRFGKVLWNYGSTNHPRDTNVAMRAWCWRTWVYGGDGLLPWRAVASANSWNQATELTVFYPGSKFGKDEPFASVRLKAYRRGQQDAEYLNMLAAKSGWDRQAVARAVGSALDLTSTVEELFPEDAGTIRFERADDDEMDRVRLRIAAALLQR